METQAPARTPSWIKHVVVFPIVTVAATIAFEAFGITGFFALMLCGGLWMLFLFRSMRWYRIQTIPKLVGGLVTVVLILLVRPPLPDGVPIHLADLLFRELLEGRDREQTYYLEVDGNDPTPELLQRLADTGVNLKPRSAAPLQKAGGKDEEPRVAGTVLSVGKLDRRVVLVVSLAVDINATSDTGSRSGRRCIVLRLTRWWIMGSDRSWGS